GYRARPGARGSCPAPGSPRRAGHHPSPRAPGGRARCLGRRPPAADLRSRSAEYRPAPPDAGPGCPCRSRARPTERSACLFSRASAAVAATRGRHVTGAPPGGQTPAGATAGAALPGTRALFLPATLPPPLPAALTAMKKIVRRNAFYAQSGGVSAVINASACGVIETAMRCRQIGKLYAGRHGIIGALTEDLIDVGRESAATLRALKHTPAGAFGSARFKLKSIEQNRTEYERLIEVFRAHDIGYFFYNGGNDSMDTALKVSQLGAALGYPITCVGVPKTVDNDLPATDCCPGFGSVAKYVAVSTREAALDVASMARTSTRVFVFEVMGRHAGWIAAAAGLAGRGAGALPMGERAGAARAGRQQREEAAARLHPRGRLRHHRGLPPLPRAADRRRSLSALQERAARLRAHQGRSGAPQAERRVQDLT